MASSDLVSNTAPAENTPEDIREYVTPYEFSVSEDLIGSHLAGPWIRGWAILLDLLFVVLLAELGGEVLTFIIAVMFYRSSGRLKAEDKGHWRRKFMRFSAGLIIAILILSLMDPLTDKVQEEGWFSGDWNNAEQVQDDTAEQDDTDLELNTMAMAKLFAQVQKTKAKFAKGLCDETSVQCWQPTFAELERMLTEQGVADDEKWEALLELMALTEMSEADKQLLLTELQLNPAQHTQMTSAEESDNLVTEPSEQPEQQEPGAEQPTYSILELIRGIASDLGLSFGWAAVYFSLFTAWWHGQTPAKALFKIKVVKLNGEPISIWDAFGRYGGYGAGLATGLLGFAQIYWDPNRMAIQDKISETVVISLRKPKIRIAKENEKN